MRRKSAILMLAIILAQSATEPVWAMDAQTAQAYCDNVKQAATAAQNKYLLLYKPPVDPGKVFDDATSSCLDFITNFQVNIPSIFDGILAALAKQLLQRVCQAARAQFDQAVNNATATVNKDIGPTGQGLGVHVGATYGSSNGQGDGVSGSVTNNNSGSLIQNTMNSTVNRVVNLFK